jgi:hypothetical protein
MPPFIELPKRPCLSESSLRQKIDRAGELDRQIQLVAPAVDEYEALKKEIADHFGEAPADKPQVADGDSYQVQLGTKRRERTIVDKKKVFGLLKKALGFEGLLAVIDISLGTVDKNLPESASKNLINDERSGYRTFKLVARRPQGAKAA